MQSQKLTWKTQWDDFSDVRGGVRDPARHTESVLWEFIMEAKPRCPTKILPQKYHGLIRCRAADWKNKDRSLDLQRLHAEAREAGTAAIKPSRVAEFGADSDCSTEASGADLKHQPMCGTVSSGPLQSMRVVGISSDSDVWSDSDSWSTATFPAYIVCGGNARTYGYVSEDLRVTTPWSL